MEKDMCMHKKINIILRVITNDGVSKRITNNIDCLIKKYPNAEINIEITEK